MTHAKEPTLTTSGAVVRERALRAIESTGSGC